MRQVFPFFFFGKTPEIQINKKNAPCPEYFPGFYSSCRKIIIAGMTTELSITIRPDDENDKNVLARAIIRKIEEKGIPTEKMRRVRFGIPDAKATVSALVSEFNE